MTRTLQLLCLALVSCAGRSEEAGSAQLLRAGCSADDQGLGPIDPRENLQVKQSLAGGDQTCYSVTVIRDGAPVNGYVLGSSLPAVAAFVRRQASYRDASFVAQESRLVREPAPAAAYVAANRDPRLPSTFESFSETDATGKQINLAQLGGRLILVTFWSPRNAGSKRQLLAVMPLYNQFRRAGLRAVGICMDPNPYHIAAALDDITLNWPQVPDRSGLARRYRAPSDGTTFLLDSSRHILAAGLPPADLEKKVRELLASR